MHRLKQCFQYPNLLVINEKYIKNKDKIFDTMKTVDNSLKGIKKCFGAGITVTDNEIKDIVKVIKSLENRGVLLKGNY